MSLPKTIRAMSAPLALSSVLLVGAPAAHAACSGPVVDVVQEVAAPRRTITVTGEGWRIGCNDTPPVVGQPAPKEPPDSPRILFSQNGRTVDVGRAVTDPNTYKFVIRVRVPAWATPGDAVILGRSDRGTESEPAAFTVAEELPVTGRSGVVRAALSGVALIVLGTVVLGTARHASPR